MPALVQVDTLERKDVAKQQTALLTEKNQISGSQAESKWHKLKEEQQRKLPKEVSILQSSTSNVPETTALLAMIRKNIESILQLLQSEMALLAMILKKYW